MNACSIYLYNLMNLIINVNITKCFEIFTYVLFNDAQCMYYVSYTIIYMVEFSNY